MLFMTINEDVEACLAELKVLEVFVVNMIAIKLLFYEAINF